MVNLVKLTALAILDTTYPEREFTDFFAYWHMLTLKRWTDKNFNPNNLIVETCNIVLAKWDTDENYELKPASWAKKEKRNE